ncbi:hypothetical protein K9848_07025 [Latilactobacillus sakei]|uniref:hypothetical protein n=1 Tax=Latilactobacillus sakei TaxID=1599 RepID=UPI0020C75437|nr:hypothetical protein [Latilactobacillus sakei]MCP8855944.1 hypothetical protein [Latilactobacillus sakei]
MRKVTIYTKTGKQCEIDTTESRNSLAERLYKGFKKRRPAIVGSYDGITDKLFDIIHHKGAFYYGN